MKSIPLAEDKSNAYEGVQKVLLSRTYFQQLFYMALNVFALSNEI